jgi:hypothetical protein
MTKKRNKTLQQSQIIKKIHRRWRITTITAISRVQQSLSVMHASSFNYIIIIIVVHILCQWAICATVIK